MLLLPLFARKNRLDVGSKQHQCVFFVTYRHTLAADAEFAALVLGQRFPRLGVDELDLEIGQDEADGALLGVAAGVVGRAV
jgi:hypothetical protein